MSCFMLISFVEEISKVRLFSVLILTEFSSGVSLEKPIELHRY